MSGSPFASRLRLQDALSAAHRVFDAGDYENALCILDGLEPAFETHLLRAKVFRQLGYTEDMRVFAREALRLSADNEERAKSLCVLSIAETLLENLDLARNALEQLPSREHLSTITRGESGLCRAILAYASNDANEAEIHLMEAYRSKDEHLRCRTLQLHAFILGMREDYRQACSLLQLSLQELRCRPCAWLEAHALMNLSFLVCEFPAQVDFPALRMRLRLLRWTKHLHQQRFWANRNFGLRLVLEGGVRASLGLSLLRTSEECATTDAQRVLATLDSAQADFRLGEPQNGRAALLRADELAREVDWSAETGIEQLALLIAAELFANENPDRAAGYLRMYTGLSPMEKRMQYAHDRRLEAMENHARGIVSAAIGDTTQAVEQLKAALEVFERIGYRWRASACALKLHELTHERAYSERASRLARAYPESWLAEMVAKIKA